MQRLNSLLKNSLERRSRPRRPKPALKKILFSQRRTGAPPKIKL